MNSETIASVMGIPRGYVLKITKKLVRAGIAARVIGAQGGFLLDKGPEKISLYEIINIMEPTTRPIAAWKRISTAAVLQRRIARCVFSTAVCRSFWKQSCKR